MTRPTFTALCPGCFAEKGSTNICPQCGYDESLKRGPLVLAHRTLLHNGQYLIGKVLGKPGGFGITYLALDTRLETRVAIKEYLPRDLAGRDAGQATINAHSLEDGEFFRYGLTQFLQEARTLARFDHANIVRVRNFFEENGTGYLVMDYYDGVTLADHLAQQPQGRLTEETAVGILMPILDGLREVHAKNILHRDIKPQNIYLTTGNRPILLDFGAARQAMSERSRSLSVVLSEGYAPYEQYHRRGEQGPWTDIYASAAVLYHAVAGEPPPPATERVAEDELDIDALGVSAALTSALRAGLAVDPRNRPQTVAEFQRLLLSERAPPVLTKVAEPRPQKESLPLPVAKAAPSPSKPPGIAIDLPKLFLITVVGWVTVAFVRSCDIRDREPPPMPAPVVSPAATGENTLGPSAPTVQTTVFRATHAVAAIKANIRTEATPTSAVAAQVVRETELVALKPEGEFFQVRLADGTMGFLRQDLAIPIKDLARLRNLTGKDYVDQRAQEKRLEKLLTKIKPAQTSFVAVLYALGTRSDNMKAYLQDLAQSGNVSIEPDTSAAIWFSISAKAGVGEDKFDDGYWNARAAIEADPTNAEYHVALALLSFQQGKNSTVGAVGRVLPVLAPYSTNSWMIFGMAEALDNEAPNELLATGAFILGIKLSRNPENTRKYYKNLIAKTTNNRLEKILRSSLAEEKEKPTIFGGVGDHNSIAAPAR